MDILITENVYFFLLNWCDSEDFVPFEIVKY